MYSHELSSSSIFQQVPLYVIPLVYPSSSLLAISLKVSAKSHTLSSTISATYNFFITTILFGLTYFLHHKFNTYNIKILITYGKKSF